MKKLIILLFTSFIIPFVSAVENISQEYSVDENTIALWHFNEGEGNRVYDETENNNDGTIRGEFGEEWYMWREEGRFGNTLDFNGGNESISVPYQRILIPENLTLEAWIKKSSNARGSVISKNGPYYLGFINEGNNNDDNEASQLVGAIYINNVGWVEVDGNTELELDTWYHIAMTYDGENIKIYVNGVEDSSAQQTGDILITDQALYIGWGEPGVNYYFNGLIDEVRISNIARVYGEEENEDEEEEEEPDEEPTLEERVNILQQQIEELNNRTTLLENTINNIQERLNDIIEKVVFYLTYSPRWDRRDTVCEYMRSNNVNNYTALGLRCEIRGRNCRCLNA